MLTSLIYNGDIKTMRSWNALPSHGKHCLFGVCVALCLLSTLTAATAKSLQSCPTLCDPIDGSHQAPPSLGFSRQEHWSGLPFPSPMHESEVAQSCPTLSDPMDCSLPGSSAHGIFQARVLEWGAIALSVVFFQLQGLFVGFKLNLEKSKLNIFYQRKKSVLLFSVQINT